MHKKYMILPLLLVLLFTAGLSLGQPANNTSMAENNSTATVNIASPENGTIANETILQNTTQPGNVTSNENETVTAAAAGLKFIWSVTGIEADQIIMVLDQDGTDLFGQAKYEPQTGNSWNGEVTGSVSGDKVDLTVTAQKDKLVSSKLSGTFDELNGTITGNFTQVSQGKIMNKGSFTAIQISPDTSSYTPATIEQPKAAAVPAPAIADTATPEATEPKETVEAEKPKSRFVNVEEYAEKQGVGGDLSGVPPGMGGSGL